jgi:hypothetical protein
VTTATSWSASPLRSCWPHCFERKFDPKVILRAVVCAVLLSCGIERHDGAGVEPLTISPFGAGSKPATEPTISLTVKRGEFARR